MNEILDQAHRVIQGTPVQPDSQVSARQPSCLAPARSPIMARRRCQCGGHASYHRGGVHVTSKERVLTAVGHNQPDRAPIQ
ncbi:MAG: hypothetical protein JXR94_20810, partial [Candidatus Hydrogenedentes bacterium]|nr:hypothetical protein [Candidatus Hydrogenedentota bacterium]